MFKKTSDSSQFRLRSKGAYSGGETRKFSYYAFLLHQNRASFSSYHHRRISEAWEEVERDGEISSELPWLREFVYALARADREWLQTQYDVATMSDPDDL